MTQDSIGRFVWHDLMTTDAAKAMPFYKTLFGWNVIAHDMGGFEYQMIHIGDLPIGGFIQENLPKGVPSHWMTYVRVDDLDSCLEAVTDNGGEICVPAMPIPGTGRFAVITDPHGAAISPIQLDEAKPLPEQGTGSMFCWDELHSKNPVESKAFYTSVFGWTWGEMDMGPEAWRRASAVACSKRPRTPDRAPPGCPTCWSTTSMRVSLRPSNWERR